MAINTKNVLVGAANIFISNGNTSNNDGRPTTKTADLAALFNSGANAVSARQGLLVSTKYREVGLTSTGLEVSYEPTYGEVMVDQLLDAARLFKQTLKVILKTELVEGTLENLQLSWGQMDNVYVQNAAGSVINAPTLINNDSAFNSQTFNIDSTTYSTATLALAAGALGDAPVERVLVAVGQAPQQIGTTVNINDPASGPVSSTPVYSTGTGSAVSQVRSKERVYVARRVVSIDTTAHGLKRDSATVFPVTFRCLPDSDPAYAGSEYGVVIDRVYSSN
jgi:hypothetical protein